MVMMMNPIPSGANELPPKPRNDSHLKEGWRYYRDGDIVEAIKAYKEALKSFPEDKTLWYDLGCLRAMNEEYKEGISAFHKALKLDPEMATAVDGIGQLYEMQGNLVGAQDFYDKAANIEVTNAAYLNRLARVRLQFDDLDSINNVMNRLLNIEPENQWARYHLAATQLKKGAPDIAIIQFLKVLKKDSNHILALNGLALAYIQVEKYDEAIRLITRAVELDPDNAQNHVNLGYVEASRQNWEAARKSWKQALALYPEHADALSNLNKLDSIEFKASP